MSSIQLTYDYLDPKSGIFYRHIENKGYQRVSKADQAMLERSVDYQEWKAWKDSHEASQKAARYAPGDGSDYDPASLYAVPAQSGPVDRYSSHTARGPSTRATSRRSNTGYTDHRHEQQRRESGKKSKAGSADTRAPLRGSARYGQTVRGTPQLTHDEWRVSYDASILDWQDGDQEGEEGEGSYDARAYQQ